MTKLSDNSENIKEIPETIRKFITLCAATIDYYYGINNGNEVMLIPLKDGGLAVTVTDNKGNEFIKSEVECSKEEADDCLFKILEDAISDYEFDRQVKCRSREINNISEHSSQLDFSKIVNKSNSSRDTQNIALSFVHANFKLSFYQPKGLTEKVNQLIKLHKSIIESKSKANEQGRPYIYSA